MERAEWNKTAFAEVFGREKLCVRGVDMGCSGEAVGSALAWEKRDMEDDTRAYSTDTHT